MLAQDGIRPRRVHNVDVAQEFNRRRMHPDALFSREPARLLAILQDMNMGRRRGDAFLQHCLADERIDKGRFAAVELAGNDQQEELVQLADRLRQGRPFLLLHTGIGQKVAQAGQNVPRAPE